MKYRVSMTILNRETLEQRFVDKDFESEGLRARFDAQHFAEEIESTLEEDEVISYRKVKPVVQCVCGEEIFCTEFTNTCDCGRDYNFNGTLLAPRSQWGEETGEHWQKCYYKSKENW